MHLVPLMYLAGLGLVLTSLLHVSSLLGLPYLFGEYSWGLFSVLMIGAVLINFPAVIVTGPRMKDVKANDFWKEALAGCPNWMRYQVYFFFGYFFLNFILLEMSADTGGKGSAGGLMPLSYIQYFSAGGILAYSIAMALYYSAIHHKQDHPGKRCPNGHLVSSSAKFCGECGLQVMDTREPK